MSRAINDQTSGKLEKNAQAMGMGEIIIGSGVDSRNMMSMAKSEVGNPAAHLRKIPERNKDLRPGSDQVWPAQNYSEGVPMAGCAK